MGVKSRILHFCIWISLYLFFLEAFLRLGGFLFLAYQDYKNHTETFSGNVYKIMCVGDSDTAEGGENSYPSQLEKILNDQKSSLRFKVINKGVPSADSTIIMKDFESWVLKYKPNMVIAMMGNNDRGKLKLLEKQNDFFDSVPFLGHLKIYKLFSGLKKDIQGRFNLVIDQFLSKKQIPPIQPAFKVVPEKYVQIFLYGLKAKEEKNYDLAEKIFIGLFGVKDLEDTFHFRLAGEAGECFLKQKKYRELMWTLRIAFENSEYDPMANDTVRRLCEAKVGKEEVLEGLNQLVNERPHSLPLNGLLGACYAYYGENEAAKSFFQKTKNLRMEGENEILKENYIRMHRILNKNNIKSIFVQYPLKNVALLKHLFMSEKDYDSMIFVDNEGSFQPALQPERYSEYFVDRSQDDMGHCTPKGNQILAKNIADAVLHYK